jgi:LacI family transcriptional regulator, galactose operon repressor
MAKQVTLKDIAADTGYAVSTISNVLNSQKTCYASEQTRETIRKAAKRLGYRPHFFARALRQQRTYQIGVAASLFAAEIAGKQMAAMAPAFEALGYSVIYGDTRSERDTEGRILADFQHKHVDGIIFHTHIADASRSVHIPDDIPCVIIGATAHESRPSIVIDKQAALEAAIDCLLKLGHEKILFLSEELRSNQEKMDGYRNAMTRVDLFDETNLLASGRGVGKPHEFILAHAEQFRAATAIMASNDRVAVEAFSALGELGMRVPEDCSVIGFDDADLARAVAPRLTTLRQPREEVAEAAARLMLDLINGKDVQNVVLTPELIIRESVSIPQPSLKGELLCR